MGLTRAGSRRPSDCYSVDTAFDRRWIGSQARILVTGGWSGDGIALGVRVGQLIADALVDGAPPAVVGRAAGRVNRLIEADMGTGRMEAFSDGVIRGIPSLESRCRRIALSHFCYRRRKTLAPRWPRKLPKLDVAGSTPVARSS